MLDRQPPHDLEAETGVLGSILLNPQAIDDVGNLIQPCNFYDEANRILYDTMLGMTEAGRRIDVTLLVNKLNRDKHYERIGGASYIAKVAQGVPNAAHAIHYARIVRETALIREAIIACTDNLSDAYNAEGREPVEIIDQMERRMFAVAENAVEATNTEPVPITESVRLTLATIDARIRGEVTNGLPTNFCDLDGLIGGLRPGQIFVIGARPGQGKTALAIQIARHNANDNRVLFFSLEMADEELTERMLATEAGIPLHRIRSGILNNEQRRGLVEYASRLSQLQMHTEVHPMMTAAKVAIICRRQQRRVGLDLVVVDYLQLLTPENRRDNRQEQVAKMSRRLKIMARELNVPVIVVCQLNRDAADERPKLSQLRESGAIEQDADIVVLIYKRETMTDQGGDGQQLPPGTNDPVRTDLIVAKNRQGPTGVARVLWIPPTTEFVPEDRSNRDEPWLPNQQPNQPDDDQGELF